MTETKVEITAGEMTEGWRIDAYLSSRWRALVHGESTGDCADCKGCCRNGFVIGLSKAEAKIIPHTKIGKYAVIMPLDNGWCPFLKANLFPLPDEPFLTPKCSIYHKRPQTCRDYDCRDLAMAGLVLDEKSGPAATEINTSILRHLKKKDWRLIGPYAQYVRKQIAEKKQSMELAVMRGLFGAIMDRLYPEYVVALRAKIASKETRERDRAANVGVREHARRISVPTALPCNGPANHGPANAE
jgi:hypothetical protein